MELCRLRRSRWRVDGGLNWGMGALWNNGVVRLFRFGGETVGWFCCSVLVVKQRDGFVVPFLGVKQWKGLTVPFLLTLLAGTVDRFQPACQLALAHGD